MSQRARGSRTEESLPHVSPQCSASDRIRIPLPAGSSTQAPCLREGTRARAVQPKWRTPRIVGNSLAIDNRIRVTPHEAPWRAPAMRQTGCSTPRSSQRSPRVRYRGTRISPVTSCDRRQPTRRRSAAWRCPALDLGHRAASAGSPAFQHLPGLAWRDVQTLAVDVGLLLYQLPRLCASAFRAGRQVPHPSGLDRNHGVCTDNPGRELVGASLPAPRLFPLDRAQSGHAFPATVRPALAPAHLFLFALRLVFQDFKTRIRIQARAVQKRDRCVDAPLQPDRAFAVRRDLAFALVARPANVPAKDQAKPACSALMRNHPATGQPFRARVRQFRDSGLRSWNIRLHGGTRRVCACKGTPLP